MTATSHNKEYETTASPPSKLATPTSHILGTLYAIPK